MQVVKLNNGIELPTIGLGTNTFGKVDNNWNGEINFKTKEIETALKAGYTFLDTAIVYRNEAVLGLGYKKAGILRHRVYLQTKLPSSGLYVKDENAIREAIGESLHKLATSYIDVVLIHQPRPIDEENLKIYQVLEKLVDEGKINTIGVSNFSIAQLDYLLK
ncbi:MAG TPA: aldo/keto reductase, partial [Bacilli bacterium]|nr:aldo/keto reductase [Bacilli bacterium]